MAQLAIYKSRVEVPLIIYQQIVDFLRIEWPDGFQGENKFRNWVHHEKNHAVYIVLVENNILISHVGVVWKHIEHNHETYKMYALSGMFTYPQFRRQGYGFKVLQAANEYVHSQGGDLVMIHSNLQNFYEKVGFEPLPNVVTLVGDLENPKNSGEKAFGIFLSDKGVKGRKHFESTPFYFGESLW